MANFEADADRIVTIDHRLEIEASPSYNENVSGDFDSVSRVCRIYRRRLNVLDLDGDRAVLKDARDIDEDARAGNIAVSDSRIFCSTTEWDNDCDAPPTNTVTALAYDEAGEIRTVGEATLASTWYYGGSLVARGDRAFLTAGRELVVFDAAGSDVEVTTHEMGGYWCNQLEVQDDVAYCAMGEYGVTSFALD